MKIYAQVDGSSSAHENIQPGCELTASWPSYHSDIYCKGNSCLYGSQSTSPMYPKQTDCVLTLSRQYHRQSMLHSGNKQYCSENIRSHLQETVQRCDGLVWHLERWLDHKRSTFHEAVKSCGIVTIWNPTPFRETWYSLLCHYRQVILLWIGRTLCQLLVIYASYVGLCYSLQMDTCSPAIMGYLNAHFSHDYRPQISEKSSFDETKHQLNKLRSLYTMWIIKKASLKLVKYEEKTGI